MGRASRVAAGVLVALAVLTVAIGGVAEATRPALGSESCVTTEFGVYESDESPSEIPEFRRGSYANLTDRQQGLFRRALDRKGERLTLNDSEQAAAEGMPDPVIYRETVYYVGTRGECPLIPGAPLAFNPVVRPFMIAYILFSGPLLPVVAVAALAGVAYAAARRLRY